MMNEFRSRAKGLPDLLIYAAMIGDGILLNKDGSMLAAWEYRGNDLESSSSQELDAVSARVNAMLARRGSGWMLHVDAIRTTARGYPGVGAFPDRTTLLIDEERRAAYEAEGTHYESRYVLTLTYLPPPDAQRSVGRFFIDGERRVNAADTASQALAVFRAAIAETEDHLSSVLRLRRLRGRLEAGPDGREFVGDDLLRHMLFCLTGDDHPVRLPSVPMYLDALLGARDFYGGLHPRMGRKHLRCVAITGYPPESSPGILDFLNRLPLCYRHSQRFLLLDTPAAQRQIERYRAKWFQKRKSLRNLMREQAGGSATHVDADADAMAADAVAALSEASSDLVKYGYYTSVIVLMDEHEERVEQGARSLFKALGQAGFVARIEDVNAVEAFLGTLPGHGWPNVRRPLIHTFNLAHFLPLTSVWTGPAEHPCRFYPAQSPPLAYAATSGATPFRLNLHVGDVGHTLIVGPTGAGKSTLLGYLLAQHFRYPGAQVFAFDKGYSLYPLCAASGGSYYEIGADDGPTFAPLADLHLPSERRWAQEWIETLVTLQGVALTPPHRQALHRALGLLAASPNRTLTDLVSTVQDQGLRDALAPYTLSGALGRLLDADRDGVGEDAFSVFELEHVASLGEKHFIPVLLSLFHRIERRLREGHPTLIAFGEAWLALSHSLFREKIREWLKTLRKANAAAILETQGVGDVLSSAIRDVIVESCPTKILLPNPEACTAQASLAYTDLGLTNRQIELIAQAVPKRQYYVTSPVGRRMFELGLGPIALSFLGVGGSEDLTAIRGLQARFQSRWPAEWLRKRGLPDAAARWLKLTQPSLFP